MLLLIDVFGVCMQLHEIILSILGIILFIAAIVFTALNRDVKLLIAMYLLSIVMIAFPALSKIVFADVTLDVQRLECINNQLKKDPTDSTLQDAARKKIEDIKRAGLDSTNAKTVVTVANTNALLGDSVKAYHWIEKGLKFNSNDQQLLKLQEQLLTPRVKVELQIDKVQANPSDSAAVTKLKKDIVFMQTQNPEKNTHVLTTLSKASSVLGDTAKAIRQADSAIQYNPKNMEAIKIKKILMTRPVKNH
jgi:tetratricopeptide (TPR) repeat protein